MVYDQNGKHQETNAYDVENKLIKKMIPTYNDKGLEIENNTYDHEGDLLQKQVYIHDKKNYITKYIAYYANGDKASQIENLYHKDILVGASIYDYENKNISKRQYEYNPQGKHIKTIVTESDLDNKLISTYVFKFNDKEDEAEMEIFDENNESQGKLWYQYIYDQYNNWTSKTIYEGFVPLQITEREITYYE